MWPGPATAGRIYLAGSLFGQRWRSLAGRKTAGAPPTGAGGVSRLRGARARFGFAAQALQSPAEPKRQLLPGLEGPERSCALPRGADSVGACLSGSEISSDLGRSCPAPTALRQ